MEWRLYAVRNKEGKYFRSKGYGGYGASWVEDLSKAKIYAKISPARSQCSWWFNHHPTYGIPDLIELVITEENIKILDESERVEKQGRKKQQEEIRYEIRIREEKIKTYKKISQRDYAKDLNQLSEEIKDLKSKLREF